MNHPEEPLTMVAARGALEVQIATRLLHERLPVTQAHLWNVLHKTDKTVAKALYNLEINSICKHINLGWSISPDGQYRLMASGNCRWSPGWRLNLKPLWITLWTPILWRLFHRKRVGKIPTQLP